MYELEAQRALEFLPLEIRQFFHGDTSTTVGFVGLVALGLYVGGWWALGAAALPLLPLTLLQVQEYRAPYHEAQPPLAGWSSLIVILGVPIALGLLLRLGWDRARHSHLGGQRPPRNSSATS